MLTSEELFPPEYCFAGSCSHPSPFLLASHPSPLYSLRICTPYTPSCSIFPPSLPPSLLHSDIVLTRLGTCNLFVPRPWWESGRYTLPCTLVFSRSSFGSPAALAKSALLVRNGALLRARISTASPLSPHPMPSWREIIPSFFLSFWKLAPHRCTSYESLDAPAAELRIKLRFSLDAASLVSLHHGATSSRMRKIQQNMYFVIIYMSQRMFPSAR